MLLFSIEAGSSTLMHPTTASQGSMAQQRARTSSTLARQRQLHSPRHHSNAPDWHACCKRPWYWDPPNADFLLQYPSASLSHSVT